MQIWRVQHKSARREYYPTGVNLGMYRSRIADNLNETGPKGQHPAPTDDSKLDRAWQAHFDKHPDKTRDTLFFGFATLEQLKAWLYRDTWREALDEEGFVVVQIEAKTVLVGDTQAVFDTDDEWHVVQSIRLVHL